MIIVSDIVTASRRSVRRAIAERDAHALSALCVRAAGHGADWLDLNPGHVKAADRASIWAFLVDTAEAACGLTLIIDTIDVEAMAFALDRCSRKPVLNMATPAPERLGPVLDLAADHDVDVVGGLFAGGLAASTDERLEHAAVLVGEATARGIAPSRLLLDPIVAPLASPDGERQAAAVLEVLRLVPTVFDEPPRTMIGLSNLTTASAGSRPHFAAAPFLHAAHGAGLDAVLLDTDDTALREALRLCRVFDGDRIFAAGEFSRG